MTQTSFAYVVVTLVVIVVLAISVLRYVRWQRSVNWELRRLVNALSDDVLINFIIPDGAEGEIHIDHLLLTPHGLVLLDTKDVAGAVFAGARMNTWSATLAGSRTTFNNPIPPLQERTLALSLLAPDVPIESRVLFINEATFPKGHPPEVATVQALIDEYRETAAGREPRDFATEWQAIKTAAAAA